MGVGVVGCMAFVLFSHVLFTSCHGNCRSTLVPEQKKIDIPKTTTTMLIQPINHMASALGGVGWFCIFAFVPWLLHVQERTLEFRMSQRYTMMMSRILQSIKILFAQNKQVRKSKMLVPEY